MSSVNDDNFDINAEIEEEEEEDHGNILVGSGEYQIVGIRYYDGVAHPGEYVQLIREPQNPYDRNAIRVDNMHNEKVGHIKATMAKTLAPIMDKAERLRVRLDGIIPRLGNSFTLPLYIEFYSTAATHDLAHEVALSLRNVMKRDYRFNIAREFGGNASTANEVLESYEGPAVVRRKLDWNTQQKALDEMFDKQLEDQYKNLPDVSMPACLTDITLFDYQIQGIKWLIKKETNPSPVPFYKKTTERGKDMYLCDITNSSQHYAPKKIKGSLLCDEMGLGKTIQTICLILLAPPVGIEYKVKRSTVTMDGQAAVPMPDDRRIRAANVSTLKEILKSARLKNSGKKQDLINRILDAKAKNQINGTHFPVTMRPPACSTSRCTLIVCPVSVMSSWTHQIAAHVMSGVLNLRIYHGSKRNEMLSDVQAGIVDILLVSYQTLAAEFSSPCGTNNNYEDYEEQPQRKRAKRGNIFDIEFHRIVLDEAHTIRNSKTKFFKAVKQVKAERKLAITGTPFINRSDDVYSLLTFLGLEPLNNKSIFSRSISTPIKNGNEIGLTRLRTCMGFTSLRRSKQNVNFKLVEKSIQLCSVEFSNDAHKVVYDALFGTLRIAIEAILSEGDETQALKHYTSIFEKLLRLRQSCCSGTLVLKERRDLAIKVWKEVNDAKTAKKLTAEEGLALLEKLKGAFTQESDLPECGVCLMEMEIDEGTILKRCKHIFCKTCIRLVLSKSNRKCPYCRIGFTENDVIDLRLAECAASTMNETKADREAEKFGTPPKILAMLKAIEDMKSDEKGVIFSQFTSYLDLIGKALTKEGHSFVRIDGSVSAQKRITYIDRFNSNETDSPRFILCSLLASGTGINLTRGNWAFIMDCWWNEAIETQAMDRIHRINQTRNVTILRFVMKDSIEERIISLQEAKSIQAKGVLEKLKGDEKRKAFLGDLRGLLQIKVES